MTKRSLTQDWIGGYMFVYRQKLMEDALDSVSDQAVEDKARALNVMEAIIEGEMSVDEIVEGIGNDALPKRYAPISSNRPIQPTPKEGD